MIEFEIGEHQVADHRVGAVLGQLGVVETFDADVVLRMNGSRNATGEGVEFDAGETLAGLAVAHEDVDATTGFRYR
jgi:hypothetical protein